MLTGGVTGLINLSGEVPSLTVKAHGDIELSSLVKMVNLERRVRSNEMEWRFKSTSSISRDPSYFVHNFFLVAE